MTGESRLVNLISNAQEQLGLTDDSLAKAAGYSSGKVVEMIKSGSMRLPINKAVAIADALKIDRREFFCVLMEESAPEILQVIEQVFAPTQLNATERNLIRHLRELAAGRETQPIVFDGAGVVALVMVDK